ncbi:MAG: PQQ-binding-like beta-propeller repeat protein [Verrucomicrobiota bacterium]
MLRFGRFLSSVFLTAWFAAMAAPVWIPAQERELSAEQFEDASLQYRTALHYDPLLESAFDGLMRLYRDADRVEELIGLYRSHTEQYSDDAGAKSVVIQILNRENREEAGELITSWVTLHPESTALQYLFFQFLEEKGDDRALSALSKAIDLEPNVARRGKWLEELLQLSESDEARELASAQLRKLLELEGQSPSDFLSLAKLMQRFHFWDLSLIALSKATDAGLSPDEEVDVAVMRSAALKEVGKVKEAAAILDQLLSRLASDHWRRREILSMRYSVVASEEERAEVLARFKQAYESNPENEVASLDYAEMLIANERQSEAIRVVLAASEALPSSNLIEARALELLEAANEPLVEERFLEDRLENNPDRNDLRFQLVKVRYSLGKDAEAEQDFGAVVAGLEPDELSERILELQRFLRTIDRLDAAGGYLERFVSSNPDRLDVARELAEVYLVRENPALIETMVTNLDVTSASPEAASDLADFLIAEGFLESARVVLSQSLETDPSLFENGLKLIEVYGELGNEAKVLSLAPKMRELADSAERYARWLGAAVSANTRMETLDRFFREEQALFSFDSDDWPEEKVEKFILLCEAGKRNMQVEAVAQTVRSQLETGTFDSVLRVRLRRFLVGMLASDPSSSSEVEVQLKALAEEDTANRSEYDLQRALLYQKTQRIDLAQDLLATTAFSEVKSPQILQEAIEVMIGYGFLEQAAEALKVVNSLLPEDVFSWERRLTVLASLNRESDFRNVVRTLRSGDAGVDLRADSEAMLDEHLQASFWRSVSRLVATGEATRFEETLPLLASVEREGQSLDQAVWTEWTRALVLATLGREEESAEALERLSSLVEEQEMEFIDFPDGLSLAKGGAAPLVQRVLRSEAAPVDFNPAGQLTGTSVAWAFEVENGAQIEQFARSDEEFLAIDNRGTVYALNASTGKLLWSERLGQHGRTESQPRPDMFILRPDANEREDLGIKTVRPFLVGSDRFLVFANGALNCFSTGEGSLLWSAQLPGRSTMGEYSKQGARPDTILAMEGNRVVAFRPDEGWLAGFELSSGKQEWETRVWKESPQGTLSSLGSGLDIDHGRVFAYGWQSVVLDSATGQQLWGFDRSLATTFPVTLRQERGEDVDLEEETAIQVAAAETSKLVDFTGVEPSSGIFSSLENETLSLVSPAVYWTRSRLLGSVDSYGVVSDGFLWLMQGSTLRRLSLRLPVASRQLEASGTFLGVVKNHAWFLDGQTLHHLDFNTERVTSLDLRELGRNLRVAMAGNQLIVRGSLEARVINALTGRVVSTTAFPTELLAYLKEVAEVRPYEDRAKPLWRGVVYQPENGEPRYCLPIQDTVSDLGYVTQFGGNVLVCLRPAGEDPMPAEETPQN